MDENKVKVTLKIFRFNPETDKKSHYDTYKLEAERTERVLDLLEFGDRDHREQRRGDGGYFCDQV